MMSCEREPIKLWTQLADSLKIYHQVGWMIIDYTLGNETKFGPLQSANINKLIALYTI